MADETDSPHDDGAENGADEVEVVRLTLPEARDLVNRALSEIEAEGYKLVSSPLDNGIFVYDMRGTQRITRLR